MDRELKDRWVAALRSGKYPQGTHSLKSCDRYCCLGVLCDLLADDGLIDRELKCDDVFTMYDGKNGYLSSKVQNITGLDPAGCVSLTNQLIQIVKEFYPFPVNQSSCDISLAVLNDNSVPFNIIADIIEECL